MRLTWTSARMRLTLWHAAVLAASLLGFGVLLYLLARASWRRQLDAQLNGDYRALSSAIAEEPRELRELDEHGLVPAFWVAGPDSTGYVSAAWRNAALAGALAAQGARDSWRWISPDGRPFRLRACEISTGDGVRRVVVARDALLMERSLDGLALTLLLSVPAILSLASLAGYFLAGRVLAPTRAITAKARDISADRLSERLPVVNPDDEFGQLAAVFNDVLSRLEASFAQLKRFTADASHELRTPLTAIRSVGEVGLQREHTVEGLRAVIGSLLEESDRLTLLVDALLTITRTESPHARLALAPLDLRAVVRAVVDEMRVLAEEKGQAVTLDGGGQVTVRGERMTLRHAVINLLDNAIKYTGAGGAIGLTVGHTPGGDAYVEVRDTGPGIAAEQHQAVFQRFYRARVGQADQPGVGLGLAIVQRVAELHGGRVELESEVGRGSTFRFVLPRLTPSLTAQTTQGQTDGR